MENVIVGPIAQAPINVPQLKIAPMRNSTLPQTGLWLKQSILD
jgi:hypothetical protein